MFEPDWRTRFWAAGENAWDLIVIGGGITGVGILREAARAGVKALLIERDDFAAGTSSRSSKLVHGGLRYLASGDWRLTRESVRERQALMRAAPGLVEPLTFLVPMYAGHRPGRLAMSAALKLYDRMAGLRYSHYLDRKTLHWRTPSLNDAGLKGAFAYRDARTDDARLVLRVLSEALADGATAANYVAAESLLIENDRVAGVRARDAVTGDTAELRAPAVINATGPWADGLRAEVDGGARLRPLRGSHFLFDFARLPVAQAVTLFHPRDRRPLFAFPWEGVTVLGTTDLDHANWPAKPARMSSREADYLLEGAAHYFPGLGLRRGDALCTYAGIRPVVAGGAGDPSAESRESAIWDERGLLTVTGGKLTTYRVTALEALAAVRDRLPRGTKFDPRAPILRPAPPPARPIEARLAGRYGEAYTRMRRELPASEFAPVPGSVTVRAELRWALRHETVAVLDDLLLRRTRLGLVLPDGGAAVLDDVGELCRAELGWDEQRWRRERDAYLRRWREDYAAPREEGDDDD
jgi:glycerol-3-phosphate dehydrogenase